MELSYRDKTIKYTVYCLVLTAAAILQNVFAARLEIFGARCFIVLPVAVIIALYEHEWAASLLGLFAGAMLDMFSAQHRGYSCFFLMLACFTLSALVEYLFRNNFQFSMLASAAVIIIYVLLYWILYVLIPSKEGAGTVLAHFYIPSIIYTLAVTPVIYLALTALQKRLNRRAKEV